MLKGLGAYPSDSYYDPDRPSWLPYWIDTLTESSLKWGAYPGVTTLDESAYGLPSSPPAPAAPSINELMGNWSWTPGAMQSASDLRYSQWASGGEAIPDPDMPERTGFPFWLVIGVGAFLLISSK